MLGGKYRGSSIPIVFASNYRPLIVFTKIKSNDK